MIAWLWLLVALALAGPVEDGAAAWEAGDMDGAIAAWQQVLDEGGRGSAVLHENLGVAWYRKGDLPRAIAHWRQARILSPRDSDPPHNLAVARSELEGTPSPNDPLPPWLTVATVGELGILGTALLLLASAGGWLSWLRGWSGWPWLAVAALGVVLGLGSVEGARRLQAHPGAIVVGDDLGLRPDPDMAAPPQRQLLPGTELAVERQVGDFVLVRTSDGQGGFVPRASLALVGVRLILPADR